VEYEYIAYGAADGIATITLNRPQVLNALNIPIHDEMLDALDRAEADDSVRVVIFTGAGRAFCAGADLSGGAETFNRLVRDDTDIRDRTGYITLRLFDFLKPVIAAINGPAVGAGIDMTLAMDIRMASESARFGFVFTRRGIVPESASCWFLPHVVPLQTALEWVYSGRVFPASEALSAGLVRSVHAPDELLPAARALAREIAENTSAVSVGLTRQMFWKTLTAPHPMDGHNLDSRGVDYMGQSDDAREGVTSFLEKRPPRFTMSVVRDMPRFYPWWQERQFTYLPDVR
jgi:enoyl-CoA hydratase/carnithine racemase